MKIRKRLFLAALAAVFAGTMSFSAFAETKTTITVSYIEPTIEVTVPTTGKAYIDPYGLPVEVEPGLTVSGQQIASAPMAITNKSDVALEVNVAVTGAVSGTVLLTSEEIASDDTGKKAFVYLQMKEFTQGTDASAANVLKNLESLPIAYDSSKDVVVMNGRTNKSPAPMATLLAAKDGTPQVGSNAAFRLAGSCVKAPRDPWTSADGLTATVVFTFSPPSN